MPFTPADGADVELLPDGRVRLTADLVWTGTRGDAVLMPAGTVSDGASRPRATAAIVDEWGPITRAAFVHDVLCDAANAWSAAGCPEATRPRFLGPDIDGALRAAARDLGAGSGVRWLYWVAVRWAALFGSRGRRIGWWRTLPAVLALTLPAVLVMLPAVAGALLSRGVLLLVDLAAYPWTRRLTSYPRERRAPLEHAPGRSPRQYEPGAASLARAAAATPGPAPLTGQQARDYVRRDCRICGHSHEPGEPHLTDRAALRRMAAEDPLPGPVGPTSGPQQVVRARRAAARQRDQEPAPWCASYLRPCEPNCQPAYGCHRNIPAAGPHVVPHDVCGCGWRVDPSSPVAPYDQAREHERNPR